MKEFRLPIKAFHRAYAPLFNNSAAVKLGEKYIFICPEKLSIADVEDLRIALRGYYCLKERNGADIFYHFYRVSKKSTWFRCFRCLCVKAEGGLTGAIRWALHRPGFCPHDKNLRSKWNGLAFLP